MQTAHTETYLDSMAEKANWKALQDMVAKADANRATRYKAFPELTGIETGDCITDTDKGHEYKVRLDIETGRYILSGVYGTVSLFGSTFADRLRKGRYLVAHVEPSIEKKADPLEARNAALRSALLATHGSIVWQLGTWHLSCLTADSSLLDIHVLLYPLGKYETREQRESFISRKYRKQAEPVLPFLSSRVYNDPEPEDTQASIGFTNSVKRALASIDPTPIYGNDPLADVVSLWQSFRHYGHVSEGPLFGAMAHGPDKPAARNLPVPSKPRFTVLAVHKPQGTFHR